MRFLIVYILLLFLSDSLFWKNNTLCQQSQTLSIKDSLCKTWTLVESIEPNYDKPIGMEMFKIDTLIYSLDSIYKEKITFESNGSYNKSTRYKNSTQKNYQTIIEKGTWKTQIDQLRIIFNCCDSKGNILYACSEGIIIRCNGNTLQLQFQHRDGYKVLKKYVSINNQNK